MLPWVRDALARHNKAVQAVILSWDDYYVQTAADGSHRIKFRRNGFELVRTDQHVDRILPHRFRIFGGFTSTVTLTPNAVPRVELQPRTQEGLA